jgi:hypothetical protein
MPTYQETNENKCYLDCPRKEQFLAHARKSKDGITLEEVDNLYSFLQGKLPPNLYMKAHPHLTSRMAFRIIYYLQEQMGLLPDNYERCITCGELYDADEEGSSEKGMHCDWHRKD